MSLVVVFAAVSQVRRVENESGVRWCGGERDRQVSISKVGGRWEVGSGCGTSSSEEDKREMVGRGQRLRRRRTAAFVGWGEGCEGE